MEPTRPLDVTREKLTVQDLTKLKVQNNKGVIQLTLDQRSSSANKTSWLGEVSGLDSHGKTLKLVAKELDAIADHVLWTAQDLVQKLERQEKKSTRERIWVCQDALAQLETVLANLKTHDTIIESYNKNFFTPILKCDNHQNEIAKIESQATSLRNRERILTTSVVERQLKALKAGVMESTFVDRHYIRQYYPGFLSLIKNLPQETQEKFLSRYHAIINEAYLDSISRRIGPSPLPASVAFGLKQMGYSEKQLEDFVRVGLDDFAGDFLKISQDKDLDKISPPDLVIKMQKLMMQHIAKAVTTVDGKPLTTEQQQRLMKVMNAFYSCEAEIQQRTGTAVKQAKQDFLNEKTKIVTDADAADYRASIERTQIDIVSDLFTDLIIPESLADILDIPAGAYQKRLDVLKGSLENLARTINHEIVLAKAQQKLKDASIDIRVRDLQFWMDENRRYCCFRFNQGDWGDDEMLGDGICAALTYRWAKAIMKNPGVTPKSAVELVGSNLSAADRFLQATYALGFKQKTQKSWQIPPQALERDGLTERLIESQKVEESYFPKLSGLMDHLKKLDQESKISLADSQGIFLVGGYGTSGAHALGLQMDDANKHFAFWDVNGGMWRYPTLEQAKKAYDSYLKVQYPLQEAFEFFEAVQLLPKKP